MQEKNVHMVQSSHIVAIFSPTLGKIRFSSMPNFASMINSHNKKIINNNIPKPSAPTCNCPSKITCPLNDDCLQPSLV